MIYVKVKIHDKFSFEFKISYVTEQDSINDQEKEFSINTWLFVPNSLDINRTTYSKDQFYKDTKSNVRLITPIFSLQDIYTKQNNPISIVNDAIKAFVDDPESEINQENYAYQIRMFACIFKSSSRDITYSIIETSDEETLIKKIDVYSNDLRKIFTLYRNFSNKFNGSEISKEKIESYKFGDDFIGNVMIQHVFRIMKSIKKRPVFERVKSTLIELIDNEIEYKKKHDYTVLEANNESQNYLVLMRRGILKKFIESDLYLSTKNYKDGAFAEQFYYGLAAGLSMIFATVVSFTAQQRYGNFTGPFFFALVISYIFKDRIKDLMRYYFSNQLGRKYFDTKRELEIRNENIGWIKEAFDFVPESKIPAEIIELRKRTPLVEAENRIYNEQIILYKKLVKLSRIKINQNKNYKFIGINDITRFNITHFVQKTDNPFVSIYTPDVEDGFKEFMGEKVYAIYFILRIESQNKNVHLRKFRLLFNRDGIKEIQELED